MVPPSTVEPMRAMSLLAARPAVGEEEEEPEDVLLLLLLLLLVVMAAVVRSVVACACWG